MPKSGRTGPAIDLDGRTALVTGGTRGIGQAIAVQLAAAGARVVIVGRADLDRATVVAARVTDLAAVSRDAVIPAVCDNAQPDQIAGLYRQARRELGGLDILVNNAGVLADALLGMIPQETIDTTFAVNAIGPIQHMQRAVRLMRDRRGSIINVSSIIGRVGNSGQTVYGASKAALIGATLSAAKELAPQGIRVNAVCPGFIDTDMTAALPPEQYAARAAAIRMGRVGTPHDVAAVVLFLASDLAGYVTGQVIGVDGGMLI